MTRVLESSTAANKCGEVSQTIDKTAASMLRRRANAIFCNRYGRVDTSAGHPTGWPCQVVIKLRACRERLQALGVENATVAVD